MRLLLEAAVGGSLHIGRQDADLIQIALPGQFPMRVEQRFRMCDQLRTSRPRIEARLAVSAEVRQPLAQSLRRGGSSSTRPTNLPRRQSHAARLRLSAPEWRAAGQQISTRAALGIEHSGKQPIYGTDNLWVRSILFDATENRGD